MKAVSMAPALRHPGMTSAQAAQKPHAWVIAHDPDICMLEIMMHQAEVKASFMARKPFKHDQVWWTCRLTETSSYCDWVGISCCGSSAGKSAHLLPCIVSGTSQTADECMPVPCSQMTRTPKAPKYMSMIIDAVDHVLPLQASHSHTAQQARNQLQ